MPLGPLQQIGTPIFLTGRLRHRIKIVQPTLAQDSTGGVDVRDDAVVGEAWATVEALSASDKFAAHEFVAQVSHKVIMRWRPGITSKMRIVWRGKLLLVEGVLDPDGRRKMLILMCIELFDNSNTPMGGG